jgi:hypothetical protein
LASGEIFRRANSVQEADAGALRISPAIAVEARRGDAVRIDADGGAYAGLVATVDKIDSRGRIEVLLGMIRHTLSADIVVAA